MIQLEALKRHKFLLSLRCINFIDITRKCNRSISQQSALHLWRSALQDIMHAPRRRRTPHPSFVHLALLACNLHVPRSSRSHGTPRGRVCVRAWVHACVRARVGPATEVMAQKPTPTTPAIWNERTRMVSTWCTATGSIALQELLTLPSFQDFPPLFMLFSSFVGLHHHLLGISQCIGI